jgi:hypothetical protein
MTERVPFTLGTMEEMGATGLPLELAGILMDAYASFIKKPCRICGKQMQGMLCFGATCSHTRHALHELRRFSTDWTICDSCADEKKKE